MLGKRLLKNRFGCSVVISELATHAGETPDVFGLRDAGMSSYLIECKTSRSDFLVDIKKPWRGAKPNKGLGVYRFYMAPAGLLKPYEMPDKWGLIEVHGRRKCIVVLGKSSEANCDPQAHLMHDRSTAMEMMLMHSLLRRVSQGKDVSKYLS